MSKFRVALFALAALGLFLLLGSLNYTVDAQQTPTAPTGPAFVYLSPTPGHPFASAGTTIAVRAPAAVDEASLDPAAFTVTGSASGVHGGSVRLARDGQTVIFVPQEHFVPGEHVAVSVRSGIHTAAGAGLEGAQWSFTVSTKPYPYTAAGSSLAPDAGPGAFGAGANLAAPTAGASGASAASATATQVFTMPHYVTAPDFHAQAVITQTGATLGSGLLFSAPFWRATPPQYLMIFDDHANLVYYNPQPQPITDFKRQPNGQLSYFDPVSATYKVLDSSYRLVDTWAAGNGYVTDQHELKLLPNGHALLMIYDQEPYDLSPYGGSATATVAWLIIQELDADKNVVFEWNSRNYIPVTDSQYSLATDFLDYAHGNAIEPDNDGNLLISSRHLSEITKINRTTGDIIWRMGGKENQFTFIGDATLPNIGAFSFQHDIRRLPNGHITIFDNGNQFVDASIRGSRGVEYSLDETAKTATKVREFRTTPDVNSQYMGSVQRLENGNTLIGWGGGILAPPAEPREAMTEFTPDGQIAMSVNYVDPHVSYRAFRFAWQGFPAVRPSLVPITTAVPISLYYSWNGATEVVSYSVSAGPTPAGLKAFSTQAKTGFEDSTALTSAQVADCFFQVMPHQQGGQASKASGIVYLGDAKCPTALTAQSAAPASRAIALPSAQGIATITLGIDAGTVATATIVALAPNTGITQPPAGLVMAGLTFDLAAHTEASLADAGLDTAGLDKPVQVAIAYSAAQLPHIAGLTLQRFDSATHTWTSDGVTQVANDIAMGQITAQVNQPGTYALLTTNRAPVAANDTAKPPSGQGGAPGAFTPPVVIDVLDNDTDPDGDLLTLVGVTQPQHGTAAIANGKIVYTPGRDYNGQDQFSYQVRDSLGTVAEGSVTVSGAINRFFMPLIVKGGQ